jgi:hypothetical protein
MLTGRIVKDGDPPWYVECEHVGAFTQGESREADCIETLVDSPGFTVTVTETGHTNGNESNHPVLLDACVLERAQDLRNRKREVPHG